MIGLNLETLLRLFRADAGAWATLALIVGLGVAAVWASWGSRRILRRCLVLSILAHVGIVVFGGDELSRLIVPGVPSTPPREDPGIREIRIASAVTSGDLGSESLDATAGAGAVGLAADWDRIEESRSFARLPEGPDRPSMPRFASERVSVPEAMALDQSEAPAFEAAAPSIVPPEFEEVEPRSEPIIDEPIDERLPDLAPIDPTEIAEAVSEPPAPASSESSRPPPPLPDPGRRAVRPPVLERSVVSGSVRAGADGPMLPSASPIEIEPMIDGPVTIPGAPDLSDSPQDAPAEDPFVAPSDPEAVRAPVGPAPGVLVDSSPMELPDVAFRVAARAAVGPRPTPLPSRAAPTSPDLGRIESGGDRPALAPPGDRGVGRPLAEVPEVYRPRLDPNRSALARLAGASDASEEAVERALGWLAAHQDLDGRWDAGTARFRDGSAAPGEDSYTAHCPPGDLCEGECYYWEADTALTGLSLLAFLGAGYTQNGGDYAQVVGRGLDFLVDSQRADGDLRGKSRAVGMYCHAMATLALSEAYALTGDPKLRGPVERAVGFLAESQYPGLMGWRYAPSSEIERSPSSDGRGWDYDPHPPVGDTSVLGWVVLVLKSAAEIGVEVPPSAESSARNWLRRVADGPANGLARYQPFRPADPVMTAEAWLCRQFLRIGGPGPSSDEASSYLLAHPPSVDDFNIYYWYYGTLAMHQRGGPPWERWNGIVRDGFVRLQRREGHKAGSWDPDATRYGKHGGRLYTTALAALSLEVYYRYLRLHDGQGTAASTR